MRREAPTINHEPPVDARTCGRPHPAATIRETRSRQPLRVVDATRAPSSHWRRTSSEVSESNYNAVPECDALSQSGQNGIVDVAVLLIGSPGAGKSSVLDALSAALELKRVPFGSFESEQLAQGWPVLPAEDWIPQLQDILRHQVAAGRRLFLVVATPESSAELDRIIDALESDRVLVVCLAAPGAVVAERVGRREPDRWPGKAGLMAHAEVLAEVIPAFSRIDLTLDTAACDPDDAVVRIIAEMRRRALFP